MFQKWCPFENVRSSRRVILINCRSNISWCMQKLEVFYSKFYSANTFSRLGRLCERKRNRKFSKCDYSYLLLFVSLDQWNQSLSWTISRTENLINAMFWLLNIYLTGRTQEKHILTNKMTFRTSLLIFSVLLRPNHLFGK